MKHVHASLLAILFPFSASAITINGNSINPTCGSCNGYIGVAPTGGTPPYTYTWSPVPAFGQGTPNVSGLCAGTWTVTVTDAMAQEASQDFTLVDQPLGDVTFTALTYGYNQSAAHHPCIGTSDGSFSVILNQLGGTPPYTITANGMPPIGYDLFTNDPYFGYYSLNEAISVSIIDANGCQGWANVGMDGPSTAPFSADNINPACGGLNNGSVDLSFGFSGPYGPFLSVTGPSGNVYGDTPISEPLTLTGLEPGDYAVGRTYNPIYFASPCQFVEQFTIPDLGVACGTVSGEVFIDNDQDCVHDGSEVAVPYRVLTITPGPEYAITNGNGQYTRNVADGNHTIIPQGADLYPICPAVQPVPFTINGNAAIIDFADSSLVQLDIAISSGATPARVGFVQTLWAHVSNSSAQLSGPVTVSLTFDPQMSFLTALPTPANVSGNLVTWTYPAFGAYAFADMSVQLQVPADIGLLGQPYAHAWSVDQPIAESTLANNASSDPGTITAAYDPNDKTARTSSGWSNELYFIDQDEWIDYTIRFQNTGTDTAFAVVVTDTLGAELDLSTFQQGVASHAFNVEFKDDRVVEWRFIDILLPDSNVNEAASHGLVDFRIKPVMPLLPGTVIQNTANIHFDFNPPVITEPSVLVAEFSTGITANSASEFVLAPVPASDQLRIVSGTMIDLVTILAMDGRSIARQRVSSTTTTLDVSGLNSGAYLLITNNADGSMYRTPFTIVH